MKDFESEDESNECLCVEIGKLYSLVELLCCIGLYKCERNHNVTINDHLCVLKFRHIF